MNGQNVISQRLNEVNVVLLFTFHDFIPPTFPQSQRLIFAVTPVRVPAEYSRDMVVIDTPLPNRSPVGNCMVYRFQNAFFARHVNILTVNGGGAL